ncbi:MAG TPA: hypothetical protein PK280_16640 [Planctomycetota bacterium]|nr:hypothetical protein [Planctomycetota bacterium]
MRGSGRLALTPVLLLSALLAPGAAGCRPEPDYLPMAVGNRWDYRLTYDDGRTAAVRLELTGRRSEQSWEGVDGRLACLWSKEDGIVSVQQEGSRIYLLWLPPFTGAGWWTVTPAGERVWCQVTGRETVTVPAGTFRNCAAVLMEQPGSRSEMRHWFAPGVGWVRYSWGPRGGRPWLVRELTAWQLRPPDRWTPGTAAEDREQEVDADERR